ncbi:hypothetical protein ACHQM5_014953 [Ranunculus cassubicifolius]
MGSKSKFDNEKASPGKIFIGGLSKDATLAAFKEYFERYGEITDSVIMKDRNTGHPRGFGFVTYADPSVVDKVIEETHVINGKQVEIKRTIPKGTVQSKDKDLKTKKIFVGGIPTMTTEDEFKNFFSKFGKVVEHQIVLDHATQRSRGFGFIVYDNEQVVDDMLVNGNKIDMDGSQVEIKRAEPKKSSNPPPVSAFASDSRNRPLGDSYSYGDPYRGFGSGGFDVPSSGYRAPGYLGSRYGGYPYGPGGSDFGTYGGYPGSGGLGNYRGDPPVGYSSRLGPYGGGLGGAYGGDALGAYARRGGEGYNGTGYGSGAYDGGFESGPGASYGGGAGGSLYGSSRAGYSGASRYHPYSR